jgi:hypothetical protein
MKYTNTLSTFALIFVILMTSTATIYAQDDNIFGRIGSAGELFDDEDNSHDNLSFDITHNRFMGDINGVDQLWNSIGLNINSMRDIPFGEESMFSVAFGFRFAFNNFRNNGFMHIVDSTSTTQLMILPEGVARDKYKFTTNYFEIPVELRFRYQGPERMFRFSLGGVIGFRMRAFEHWTNGDLRYKEYNYPDINKFRYGVFARVGFKHLGIYAGYYLQPMFKNAGSSKLNILNFGLNIAF